MISIKRNYKSQTKNEIIKVASKLFFSKGFSNVSTKLIAESAKIAKGTLFHHFQTKEDLIFEVLMQFFMKSYDTLVELRKNFTAKETLKVLAKEALKVENQSPGFLGAILDIMIKFPPNKVELVKMKGFVPFVNFIQSLLEELGVNDSRIKAHLFIALLDGIGMQILLYKKIDDSMTDHDEKLMNFEDISDYVLDIILK